MYRPNPRFPAAMRANPAFVAELVATGEEVKHKAEMIAPRETDHYARSFVVVEEHGQVRVGNRDVAAHLIEWGSIHNPPFGVLRRAAHAAGLVLREASKT
jgi:hypothetical protein